MTRLPRFLRAVLLCILLTVCLNGAGRSEVAAYVLSPDDQIEITVLDHAEFNSSVTLLPDGSFSYPLLGKVHAAGQTLDGLTQTLTRGLSGRLNQPEVTVTLRQGRARKVSVVGDGVKSAGQYDFKTGMHLLDLLAVAGGPAAEPAMVQATLAAPTGETVSIDIAKLLTGTGAAQNLPLVPGDILFLVARNPEAGEAQVVGEVVKPGAYPLPTSGTSVLALLNEAGGALPGARLTQVQIMHLGQVQVCDLRPLLTTNLAAEAGLLRVQPGDVLLVPANKDHILALGEVRMPGILPIPDDQPLTLTAAYALVGGATPEGDKRKVDIIRRDPDGKAIVLTVSVDDLLQGKNGASDLRLRPDDILYIQTRNHPKSISDLLEALSPLALISTLTHICNLIMPAAAPQHKQQPGNTSDVTARAISGVKVLAARALISALLRVVSTLVLARLLFPGEYGLFGVAASITGLGMFLCDVGLASALVRQETAPTRNEAFTVFCTQQMITGLVAVAIAGAIPVLTSIYALPPAAKPLLLAMALGLFFSSLRIVPMLALERNLQFPVIARCELLESLAQTVSTIAFAYAGWGAWALAGGGLVRGVVGLVLVWQASPWRPAGQFKWAILRRLARFGFAFQLGSLIPALLGGWMPLVVGRLLGVTAVGLVGWAINLASVPLMLSAVLNRVAFPAYSRLSSDPDALGSSLSLSIRRLSAVFSLLIPLVVMSCPLAIPLLFQARWSTAIPLVQWFSAECSVLTLTGLLASAQNAMGYAGERLIVTVIIGGLRCSIGYCAVRHFDLLGIGPAVLLVSVAEMGVSAHLIMRRNPRCVGLLRETLQPLLVAGTMLAAALGGSRVVFPYAIGERTAVSLAVFIGLMAAREALSGGQALGTELRAIHRMLRPTRGEPQCLPT